MNWLFVIFLTIFGVFSENEPVCMASSSASARSIKHIIQDYIDEDVGPFKSCEIILKETVVVDLIEFDRYDSPFNHWAIYVGDGKVADPFVIENIGLNEYFRTTRALFLNSTLIDVADGNNCRVNNKGKSANNRGLKSKSPDEII